MTTDVLDHLARGPIDPAPVDALSAWRPRWRAIEAAFDRTGERALAGGFGADRLGWAFAAAYGSALARLVPAARGRLVALCATESGPVHPARVATTVADGRVTGRKSFVTLGVDAELLLVLARAGRDGDRNLLRVVQIEATAPGVTVRAAPALAMVPEISHAEVVFDAAPGMELPGDGWVDLVRPFRTVEDIHVHTALLGFIARLARVNDLPALFERALGLGASGCDLAARAPDGVGVHLALAGWIDAVRALVAEVPLVRLPDVDRARLERDRGLLEVAGRAREARTRRARGA